MRIIAILTLVVLALCLGACSNPTMPIDVDGGNHWPVDTTGKVRPWIGESLDTNDNYVIVPN